MIPGNSFPKRILKNYLRLKKLNKAPAVFDYKKLDWFNGQYIRMKDENELKDILLPILVKDKIISDPPTDDEKSIFDGVFPIIRERLKKTRDISEIVKFLFTEISSWNTEDAIPKKMGHVFDS